MCLLDLIEEEHAVGAASHRLGELAALLVADVARRRSDQAGDGVLLHVFRHIETDHRLLVIEEELGESPCQLCLSDPGGAQEDEGADGPVGIGEACPPAPHRVGDGADGIVLPDHAVVEAFLDVEQLLDLALQHLGDRDVRPVGDDLRDVLGVDLLLEQGMVTAHLTESRLFGGEAALQLAELTIAELGCAREVRRALSPLRLVLDLLDPLLDVADPVHRPLLLLPALAQTAGLLLQVGQLLLQGGQPLPGGGVGLLAERLALDLQLPDLALHDIQHCGQGVDLDAQPRGRLVDEVDRLVGEEAVGDVALREGRGGDDRLVRDAHPVVHLVPLLEPAEDGDGVGDRRLVDHHRLKAPLQRRVLLDVLAVLVQGGRADAAQLAAGERRLEHVAGIHGALGGAGTHDGVQLVDEEDDAAVGGGDLLEHRLEPILELAAVLGARDHRAEVEGHQPPVAE